jgi:hypothetical protein
MRAMLIVRSLALATMCAALAAGCSESTGARHVNDAGGDPPTGLDSGTPVRQPDGSLPEHDAGAPTEPDAEAALLDASLPDDLPWQFDPDAGPPEPAFPEFVYVAPEPSEPDAAVGDALYAAVAPDFVQRQLSPSVAEGGPDILRVERISGERAIYAVAWGGSTFRFDLDGLEPAKDLLRGKEFRAGNLTVVAGVDSEGLWVRPNWEAGAEPPAPIARDVPEEDHGYVLHGLSSTFGFLFTTFHAFDPTGNDDARRKALYRLDLDSDEASVLGGPWNDELDYADHVSVLSAQDRVVYHGSHNEAQHQGIELVDATAPDQSISLCAGDYAFYAITSDQRFCLCMGTDEDAGELRAIDLDTLENTLLAENVSWQPEGQEHGGLPVQVSADGTRALFNGANGNLYEVTVALKPKVRLVADDGDIRGFRASRDLLQVVLFRGFNMVETVEVLSLSAPTRRLTPRIGGRRVRVGDISPDGRLAIYALEAGKVWRVLDLKTGEKRDLVGSASVDLFQLSFGRGPRFDASGQYFVTYLADGPSGRGYYVVDAYDFNRKVFIGASDDAFWFE